MEHCENCGQPIGGLETPQVWDEHIVCRQCKSRLQKSDTMIPTTPRDRNLTIQLGVGACRRNEKPSRKLIYVLVLGWVVLSVGSVIAALTYGYATGSAMGYRFGKESGQRVGYEAGKAAGVAEGEKVARVEASSQAFSEGETAGCDKGYRTGFAQGGQAGYVRGREEALAVIRKIGISSGTTASEVRGYLGTPDRIEQYTPSDAQYRHLPCWVYGTVKIYFDGDSDANRVTHCEGDLKSLVARMLSPDVNPAQTKSTLLPGSSDELPPAPDGFIPARPATSN